MKIKEVERLTGITTKNIRFYEEQGLLAPQRNNENSYRDYSEEDLRRVKLIKVLRKLDLPLDAIRQLLSGEVPLDKAMEEQSQHLAQSIKTLETAQQFCQELADRGVKLDTLDVDGCLTRMTAIEQDGKRFADIFSDFRRVALSIEKRRFHFYPDELITTPQKFTGALLQYAREQKQDITITKECMYPEFTMDGIEYQAIRFITAHGSLISAKAVHPELLEPVSVSKGRRRWFGRVWKYSFPLILVTLLVLPIGHSMGALPTVLLILPVFAVLIFCFYRLIT